jgi:pre-rRNA-processing protein TSR3
MIAFLPTIILRHRRENLKKCSLRGLENRKDCIFLTYPHATLPDLSNYLLLSFDGPLLSIKDRKKGLFLLDGTWRYAEKMLHNCGLPPHMERRSLPSEVVTAYPRKQDDCISPSRGLASVEALYVAHKMMGKDTSGLLDTYFWKDLFLQKNHSILEALSLMRSV